MEKNPPRKRLPDARLAHGGEKEIRFARRATEAAVGEEINVYQKDILKQLREYWSNFCSRVKMRFGKNSGKKDMCPIDGHCKKVENHIIIAL
jgi:hypothetical protein